MTYTYRLIAPGGVPYLPATLGSGAPLENPPDFDHVIQLDAIAGTWTLEVEPSMQHYRFEKSGTDTGIYLGWQSAGTARVFLNVMPAGAPLGTVQFFNITTGQVFELSPFDPIELARGTYDIVASTFDGRLFRPTPSRVDLWCDRVIEVTLELPRLDNDDDGRFDEDNNCPLFPNSDQLHSDGNGAGDACDAVDDRDDDADGVLDTDAIAA
jgi:hypothetical protein